MTELDIKHLVKSSEKHLQKLRWGQPLLDTAQESRAELEAINGGPIFGREGCDEGDGGRNRTMQALFSPAIRKIAKRMRQGRHKFMEERLDKEVRERQLRKEALSELKASASALALGVADAFRSGERAVPSLETTHHKVFEPRDETTLGTSKRLVAATIPPNCPQTPSPNHTKGAVVYYGSAIALQANHGGYLGLGHGGCVEARIMWPTPPCLFTLWNMMDLGDVGAVKYGDRIWLQCSRYEVLGTSALSRDVGAGWSTLVHDMAEASRGVCTVSGEQPTGPDWGAFSSAFAKERRTARRAAETLAHGSVSRPAGGRVRETVGRLVAVPCGSASSAGARARGRWAILHRKDPHTTVGSYVMHEDEIVLHQEELYVSSRKKECCELRVPHTDISGAKSAFEKTIGSINHSDLSAGTRGPRSLEREKSESETEVLESPQPIGITQADMLEKEFGFILHIVKLPKSSLDEKRRMESAMHATIQLAKSKERALRQVPSLMRMRVDQRLDAQVREQVVLERTLNERGSLEAHLKKKYRAHSKSVNDVVAHLHPPPRFALPPSLEATSTPIRSSSLTLQPITDRPDFCEKDTLARLAQAYRERVSQAAIMLDAFKVGTGSPGQDELLRRTKATQVLQRWCKSQFVCKWGRHMSKLDRNCTCELGAESRQGSSIRRSLLARAPMLQDFFITDGTLTQSVKHRSNNKAPFPASSGFKLRNTVGSAVAVSGTPSPTCSFGMA